MHPRWLAIPLFAALVLAGCRGGTVENENNEPKQDRPRKTVGVSVLTLTNPFFKVIGDTQAIGVTGLSRDARSPKCWYRA